MQRRYCLGPVASPHSRGWVQMRWLVLCWAPLLGCVPAERSNIRAAIVAAAADAQPALVASCRLFRLPEGTEDSQYELCQPRFSQGVR